MECSSAESSEEDVQLLEETVQQLQTSGVLFCIQYVGSVVVEKSMNTLPAECQAEVARACIRLVARETFSEMKESSVEESITNTYVHGPVLAYRQDVELNISSTAIILIDIESMRPLHRFKIQDVSVLSPGPEELCSFFCFFAKVPEKGGQWMRKCFVFDAKEEVEDVRNMICFAFRLNDMALREESATPVPPETPPTPVCREVVSPSIGCAMPIVPETRAFDNAFPTPPDLPPRRRPSMGTEQMSNDILGQRSRTMSTGRLGSSSTSPRIDVVDVSPERYKELTKGLEQCTWFHGTIARLRADDLVRQNGQFLVRQSPNIVDQFVLVGMHENRVHHVCLINKEGKIQTTHGEFRDIVHLIDYYHRSRKPLILHEVQLVLHQPVKRIK